MLLIIEYLNEGEERIPLWFALEKDDKIKMVKKELKN